MFIEKINVVVDSSKGYTKPFLNKIKNLVIEKGFQEDTLEIFDVKNSKLKKEAFSILNANGVNSLPFIYVENKDQKKFFYTEEGNKIENDFQEFLDSFSYFGNYYIDNKSVLHFKDGFSLNMNQYLIHKHIIDSYVQLNSVIVVKEKGTNNINVPEGTIFKGKALKPYIGGLLIVQDNYGKVLFKTSTIIAIIGEYVYTKNSKYKVKWM